MVNKPSPRSARRGSQRPWEINLAGRHIVGRGLERRVFGDIFHHAMAVSWGRLVAAYFAAIVGVNLLFTLLYALGDRAVTGLHPPSLAELFFFSVEVFGTVSFGGFQPASLYGHVVATFEIILGISSYAVMTGLAFARFSRPKAHLLFTAHPLIAEHQGRPTLMLRVANARHNHVSDAYAKIWLIADDRPNPDHPASHARRFYRMTLLRDESPMFILSWTLFHTIDESSPLFGLSAQELAQIEAQLVIIISGFDENYGQEVRARHTYSHEDFRWDHSYVDIIQVPAPGTTHIDYGKFHDIYPNSPRANG